MEQEAQWNLYRRLKDGMARIEAEQTALRLAILYQVPTTNEELAVLTYHVQTMWDAATTLPEQEKEALEEALATIFDYMVSEGWADATLATGEQFAFGADLVDDRRRDRTYAGTGQGGDAA